MNISIKHATAADAPIICLLARMTFTEAFGYLFQDKNDITQYFATAFSMQKITRSLENKNNIFLLAYCDDLPVGYAKFKKNSPSAFVNATAAQLQKIYVLNDFVSKKIGQQLIDEGLHQLKNEPVQSIWLSVFTGNSKAIRFYERNGFYTVGRHTYSIGKETFEFFVVTKTL